MKPGSVSPVPADVDRQAHFPARAAQWWRAATATPARLMLLVAAWLASLAWLRPLSVPDEGRYTEIARWMAASGDWLVPRLDGIAFLHKPPLYFWAEAALIALFGTSAFVARLVSLAAGVLMCGAAYALVRRMLDEGAARWSVAVLALNPLLVLGAQYANLDLLVAAWITVTLVLAALASRADAQTRTRWWIAVHAAAALAMLAKGLIGIVLPGAVFVLWALTERAPKRMTAALSAAGAAAFLLIALPWFVAVERQVPGFLRYFFIHHHFQRYAEAGFNNVQAVWFYPAVLALGLLPWTLLLWPAARAGLRARGGRRSLAMLGLVWFAVVLVFFSIPRSKLVGYILPLLPAFAIMVGPWVAQWRWWRAAAVGAATLCAGLVIGLASYQDDPPARLARALAAQIGPHDRVAFWDAYYFAVPVALGHGIPVELIGDWSKPGAQLPDNWRPELKEGAEFDPQHAGVLISPAQFEASLHERAVPVWIWVGADAVARDPWLRRLPRVAAHGAYVVLRWAPEPH